MTVLKEIWTYWLPKILKGIYNIFLKPQSSAVWVAGILLAYCLIFNVGGPIVKILALLMFVLACIIKWQSSSVK